MSYSGLLNSTGAITRRGGTTNIGGYPKETWSSVTSSVECRVELRSGTELAGPVEATVLTHRGFLPYGTDIKRSDRLTIGSDVYDVEVVDSDAAGAGHHVEVLLRRAE